MSAELVVREVRELDPNLIDGAWVMYEAAFREINKQAVQRHLMYRSEFDQVMGDKRVIKYVVMDPIDTLWGLGTFTNDLDSMPLISPQYFERHWPREYEERRIWYVGFVCSKAAGRVPNPLPFNRIVDAMHGQAQGGVVVLDTCAHNENVVHLPRALGLILRRAHGKPTPTRMLDQQSYHLFDLTGAEA